MEGRSRFVVVTAYLVEMLISKAEKALQGEVEE
jgi:hypothetical protein